MAYLENLNVQNGQAPSLGTNTGNPVKIGGAYNSSPPTVVSGEVVDLQVDTNGNLKTNVSNGIAAGTAGAASANVVTVQGIASMTPVAVTLSSNAVTTQPAQNTTGGASYYNAIPPATPAVATVKSSGGNILGIRCVNLNASAVFVKFWDTASAITLGTTAATYQFAVPGNTAGAGIVIPLPEGRTHANSIKIAVTGGISLTDNTAITANTVVLDIGYN